jgi:hypothetical protein
LTDVAAAVGSSAVVGGVEAAGVVVIPKVVVVEAAGVVVVAMEVEFCWILMDRQICIHPGLVDDIFVGHQVFQVKHIQWVTGSWCFILQDPWCNS